MKAIQYVESLKRKWLHVCKGELLSSVSGSKGGVAQGKLPYGLQVSYDKDISLSFNSANFVKLNIQFQPLIHYLHSKLSSNYSRTKTYSTKSLEIQQQGWKGVPQIIGNYKGYKQESVHLASL